MTKQLEKLIETIVFRSTGGDCKLTHDEYDDGCSLLNCDFKYSDFFLNENWVLRLATDDESQIILRNFLTPQNDIAFELACHFARLLAEKGYMVKTELTELIAITDWSSYASSHLALAGLPYIDNSESITISLLDVIPNDCRDGIFIACWHFENLNVHKKLLQKFEEWIQDETWGGGDGEESWLGRFLGKWISEKTFSSNRLEKLIVWYFERKNM
jgi:hypothetical protein